MTTKELENFCFSCLLDGGTEAEPITLKDAEYTLRCWKEEQNGIAEDVSGLGTSEFMEAWNNVCNYLHCS